MVGSWIKKHYKTLIVVGFFAAFFLYGCLVFKDYGIGVDERIERDSTLINYKRMFPSVMKYKTDTVDFESLPDLSEWKDRYYGVSLQIPAVMIEHFFNFELSYRRIFQIKHLYTFCLFFVATIFFYHLGKALLKKRRWAFLAVVMLILSPRILGESFYNMKDLYFLSIYVITTYFVMRFLKKPNWKSMLLLGISTGFCVNTRVVGGILIVLALLFAVILSIQNKTWKKVVPLAVGTGVISLGTYILVTPITWTNTVQEIFNVMKTFSNYTKWPYDFLYMGEAVNAMELPWHYMFVFIGITTPLVYLALFLLGLVTKSVSWVKELAAKKRPDADFYTELTCLLLIVIPFAYVLISRPVLYTGWRHFYFMYPTMILFAAMGVEWIYSKISGRKSLLYTLSILFGGYLLWIGGWIVKNHPYEYGYFNVIGKRTAAENFERDYWGMSSYDCLNFILAIDPREEIKVWAPMTYSDYMLPPEQKQRITILTDEMDISQADYIIEAYRDQKESVDYARWNNYRELYRIEVDGIKLQSVFRRDFTVSSGTGFVVHDKEVLSPVSDLEWTVSKENGTVTIHGLALEGIEAEKMSLSFEETNLPKNLSLAVSSDGENFFDIKDTKDYTTIANAVYGTFDKTEIKEILISFEEPEEPDYEFRFVLYETAKFGDNGMIQGNLQSVEQVYSPVNDWNITFASDGDIYTHWSTETAQKEKMSYEITLKSEEELAAIRLNQGDMTNDYPRNLKIYTAVSEGAWEEAEIIEEDNGIYYLNPVECRYIKLEIGALEEEVELNWAISEVEIYKNQTEKG